MKVRVKSSWNHPVTGKTLSIGTELELEDYFFNPAFLEEVKTKSKKKTK
jgi:hypothetical protein